MRRSNYTYFRSREISANHDIPMYDSPEIPSS